MSELTQALNRIITWLSENQPSFAASFLPGLTNEQIHAAVKHLPFELPEEIYELYRWRNGTEVEHDCEFSTINFLPLEKALKLKKEIIDTLQDKTKVNGLSLLPFKYDMGDILIVLIKKRKEIFSPILRLNSGTMAYTNLTNMMLMIAECYETGAYYLIKDGFVKENKMKSAEILRKYNLDMFEHEY